MSLTVKAFVRKSGSSGNEEIRRFALDQDVASNFDYLRRKIVTVFPSLQDRALQLAWKDDENDLVVFSSDDELVTALGSVKDGIFRIYIEDITDRDTSSHGGRGLGSQQPMGGHRPHFPKEGYRHVGVECDGCEGPVIGVRFKCQTCPNYDLCSDCRGTSLHCEHAFHEMHPPQGENHGPQGGQGPFGFNIFGGARPFAGMFGAAPPAGCHGAQQSPFHHWFSGAAGPAGGHCDPKRIYKAWRHWQKQMSERKEEKAEEKQEKNQVTGMDQEGAENVNSGKESETGEKKDGGVGKEHVVEEKMDADAGEKQQTSDEKKNEKKTNVNESESSDDDEEQMRYNQYFTNIGMSLDAFVGPFMEGFAQANKKRSHSGGCGEKGKSCKKEGHVHPGCGTNHASCGAHTEGAASHGNGSQGNACGSGFMGGWWGPTGPWAGCSAPNSDKERKQENGSSTSGTKSGETTDSSSSQGQASGSSERNVDQLIAEAVETLRRIGFSDEDGWLTALLQAHRGDINQVLDHIHNNTHSGATPPPSQPPQ